MKIRDVIYLIILITCIIISFLSCNNTDDDITPPTPVDSTKVERKTFYDMVGINGGLNWDGYKENHPAFFIKNARAFYLMEIDYDRKYNPSNFIPKPCGASCTNVDCFSFSTMAANKARYCNWSQFFNQINIAPEVIRPYNKDLKRWPNKFYSYEELGGEYNEIIKNVKAYTSAFLRTYNNLNAIKIYELGNEPWGEDPGISGYYAFLNGTIIAFKDFYGPNVKDWKIKLSTGAVNLSENELQNIEKVIPLTHRKYISYISIHNYAYNEDKKLIATPESKDGQFYQQLIQMDSFIQNNWQHVNLNITEYGWNSKEVGQIEQACYILRSILLASRYNVNKIFLYELEDQPYVNGFQSMGLIDEHGLEKVSFFWLKNFLNVYGGFKFYHAIKEDNEGYIYIITDDDKYKLVAWSPDNRERLIKVKLESYGFEGIDQINISKIPKYFNIEKI